MIGNGLVYNAARIRIWIRMSGNSSSNVVVPVDFFWWTNLQRIVGNVINFAIRLLYYLRCYTFIMVFSLIFQSHFSII